jgi:hypothetical protein
VADHERRRCGVAPVSFHAALVTYCAREIPNAMLVSRSSRRPPVSRAPPASANSRWRAALSPTRLAPRRTAVQAAIAALPQGSLAPERVLLSRSIVADYDPIRRSHEHMPEMRGQKNSIAVPQPRSRQSRRCGGLLGGF